MMMYVLDSANFGFGWKIIFIHIWDQWWIILYYENDVEYFKNYIHSY